jgi:hypothetical protein
MGRPVKLSGFICYHCGSDQTSNGGWSKGKRRFKCRGCGKYFTEGSSAKPGKSYLRQNPAVLPSKQHLLMEIKAVAQELGHPPTTIEWAMLRREDRVCPLGWFYEVFGSYLKAVKLAGLKPHYSQEFDDEQREAMLDQLRKLSRDLGRPLFGEDVFVARRLYKVSPLTHYTLAYKSIPRAIAAAGVAKTIFTRDEMIEILRKLDSGLRRPIQKSDIQALYDAGEGPSFKRFLKEFGTLTKARRAAGTCVTYTIAKGQTRHWQKYTKEELIRQMKALGEKLGRKPVYKDINAESKTGLMASHTVFTSMFGSLPKAYRAAGFKIVKPHTFTDDEIVASITKLTEKLGHFPGWHDFRKASIAGLCPSPGTIIRRIGKLTEIRSRF